MISSQMMEFSQELSRGSISAVVYYGRMKSSVRKLSNMSMQMQP